MKFKDMSREQQAAYLKAHPNSKFNKKGATKQKWPGRTRSEKMRAKAFDSYFWSGR